MVLTFSRRAMASAVAPQGHDLGFCIGLLHFRSSSGDHDERRALLHYPDLDVGSLFQFDKVSSKPFDFCIFHGKNIAKYCVEKTTIPFLDSNRPFCDYDIILFDHPGNGYGWAAYKCIVFYFYVKRVLSDKMKCAWHFPLNIFG
jgi:hypothetical protein